jgi:hypothetical protein
MKTILMEESKVISNTKIRTKKGYVYRYANKLPIGTKVWVSIKRGEIIALSKIEDTPY